MMRNLQITNTFLTWFQQNWVTLAFSVGYIIIGIIIFKLIQLQISRLEKKGKVKPKLADALLNILKWIFIAIVLALILGEFQLTEDWIAGFLSLFSGTILGFAAINTIGNAIAGLIVRRVKPLSRGDRVSIDGELADVLSINIIYTKMINLNRVIISIPNQKLIKMRIRNYGNNNIVRKKIPVVFSYELEFDYVESLLLEAANQTQFIIDEPESFIRITEFGNYGIEYTLYVFFQEVKEMNHIEGELRKNIYDVCRKNNVDLITPLLHQEIPPIPPKK